MITVMVKYIFNSNFFSLTKPLRKCFFRLKFGTKLGLKLALYKNLEMMMMMIIPSCGGTVSKVNACE